jgi:hypothetical protein
MPVETPQFWFPAKRYGWGWGLPVHPAGWAVLIGYFAAIFAAIRYFSPRKELDALILSFIIATAILIAICAWKGEKPLAWRSGK